MSGGLFRSDHAEVPEGRLDQNASAARHAIVAHLRLQTNEGFGGNWTVVYLVQTHFTALRIDNSRYPRKFNLAGWG
jgi:hypothetical protein